MLRDFYSSKDWRAFRRTFLAQRLLDTGDIRCERCGRSLGRGKAVLHHKVELTEQNYEDARVALNPENIEVVCHRCHNEIHERWGRGGVRHVYVVESREWVDEAEGDVVLDEEEIRRAVGGDLGGGVRRGFMAMEDSVRTREGKWRNAWIVKRFFTESEKEVYLRRVGG